VNTRFRKLFSNSGSYGFHKIRSFLSRIFPKELVNLFIILTFFLVTGKVTADFWTKTQTETTNIDDLAVCLKKALPQQIPGREVYFLSDIVDYNHSVEMFYKAQLVMAPHVVLRNDHQDIPDGALVMVLGQPAGISKALDDLSGDQKTGEWTGMYCTRVFRRTK
jgi:hypothetical protein